MKQAVLDIPIDMLAQALGFGDKHCVVRACFNLDTFGNTYFRCVVEGDGLVDIPDGARLPKVTAEYQTRDDAVGGIVFVGFKELRSKAWSPPCPS